MAEVGIEFDAFSWSAAGFYEAGLFLVEVNRQIELLEYWLTVLSPEFIKF